MSHKGFEHSSYNFLFPLGSGPGDVFFFRLHIPRYCEFAFGCPCTVAWWHRGKSVLMKGFGHVLEEFSSNLQDDLRKSPEIKRS